MIGRTLSHYRVTEEISRGGMGIVYRARDTKLERDVALKVLPPELVAHEERKRRFLREARAAAQLKHPNLAVIHDVDEDGGVTFLVMELIEGDKLSDVLDQERLSLERALDVALEVAGGLARAHEKGVVHRDLKPANIMLDQDGHPKIIDFGLAKLVEPLGSAGPEAETAVKGETHEGQLLGTFSYMSPEQARGERIDHRSDIFSFGVVLYELLSGRVPFQGATNADVLSAILKEPPPPLGLSNPLAEPELERIVKRCLAKVPERRYPDFGDVVAELRRVRRRLELAAAPARRGFPTWTMAASGLILALVVAGVLFLGSVDRKPATPRLADPVQLTSAIGVEDYPTWSPDGRTIAYTSNESGFGSNWDIWVIPAIGGAAVNRTADHPGVDRFPSWSPDGSQIAFWSDRDGGGYYVMSALGGPARKVPTNNPSYEVGPPRWSRDGAKLACLVERETDDAAEIVVLATGELREVPLPGRPTGRYELTWSPDERFFAYVDASTLFNDVTQLRVLRIDDGRDFPITDGFAKAWSPSFSADSRTLYYVTNRGASMDLWRQRLGEDGAPDGDPEPLTTGVGIRHAAFSRDGTRLAYSKGRIVANLWRAPILEDRVVTWSDTKQLTFDHAYLEAVDVSPDGEELVVSTDRSGNMDLWLMPAHGGNLLQLTTDPTPDWLPAFSPDGREIVFYSYRSGNREIWVQPVDGAAARQLTEGEVESMYPAWSPDGRYVGFFNAWGGNNDIWIVPASGGEPQQITVHPASDQYPRWSRDGSWIAFRSRRGGEERIWKIQPGGGEAVPVTGGPGTYPRWSPDGSEIYFIGSGARRDNLWAVSMEDGRERPLTDFTGRPGEMGIWGLATDGEYLYFTWRENLGDLWTADVVLD